MGVQNFKFKCLKWPILAEMTAKSGIYFHFTPPVLLRGGGPDPPPLAETLHFNQDKYNVSLVLTQKAPNLGTLLKRRFKKKYGSIVFPKNVKDTLWIDVIGHCQPPASENMPYPGDLS